jgi:hypothetical protein
MSQPLTIFPWQSPSFSCTATAKRRLQDRSRPRTGPPCGNAAPPPPLQSPIRRRLWTVRAISSAGTSDRTRGVEAMSPFEYTMVLIFDHRRSRNHPYPREPQQRCPPASTSRTTDTTGSHLPHVGRICLHVVAQLLVVGIQVERPYLRVWVRSFHVPCSVRHRTVFSCGNSRPYRLAIVDDSWVYFLSIRSWFYGGLLVLNGSI